MAQRSYHCGITPELIATTGATIGLTHLTLSAVAQQLDVTPAALYRHVAGLDDLTRLVVREYLTEIDLTDRCDTARTYLLHCARQLFTVCTRHPGLADYIHRHILRTPEVTQLHETMADVLGTYGYGRHHAEILNSIVATIALSLADTDSIVRDIHGTDQDVIIEVTPQLHLTGLQRFTLMVAPCIDGILQAIPADIPLPQILTTQLAELPHFPHPTPSPQHQQEGTNP